MFDVRKAFEKHLCEGKRHHLKNISSTTVYQTVCLFCVRGEGVQVSSLSSAAEQRKFAMTIV